MMRCVPDYYNDFNCIADKCKHNCCIGWEIDIDKPTLDFYQKHGGELKERLSTCIDYTDTPHFILGENERCPFLNQNNLCDIFTHLGEEHLCEICTQHPRFHNELPDRTESGLGLCCEEACRLILTKTEKTKLVYDHYADTDDEIIILRDKVIDTLQNRERTLSDRVDDMLLLCNTSYTKRPLNEYAEILLSLEILDEKWRELLCRISKADVSFDEQKSFADYIKANDREHEFEQLCVYFIYRHFANAPDMVSAQERARFCAFVYDFFCQLGAFSKKHTGSYETAIHLDFARMFSSEIEYSDENIYTLYDIL